MLYTISNGILEISVKSFGAELSSLKTLRDGLEYLWQGDPAYWKGQSPILFPIIGGVPDGKYTYDGKTYEMKSHGFARTLEFELAEKQTDKLVFKLSHSEETLKQYPFEFELYISYTLEDGALRHGFKVVNTGGSSMLYSIGAHPAIRCPLKNNEKMEDYRLVFEKTEKLTRRMKEVLLTGKREKFMDGEQEMPLTRSLFETCAVILDDVSSDWLEIRNSAGDKCVRFSFEGFPYLGIWTKNDAPFICIEPWYGIDSTQGDSHELEAKEGLQKLEPGCSFDCAYTIMV